MNQLNHNIMDAFRITEFVVSKMRLNTGDKEVDGISHLSAIRVVVQFQRFQI